MFKNYDINIYIITENLEYDDSEYSYQRRLAD